MGSYISNYIMPALAVAILLEWALLGELVSWILLGRRLLMPLSLTIVFCVFLIEFYLAYLDILMLIVLLSLQGLLAGVYLLVPTISYGRVWIPETLKEWIVVLSLVFAGVMVCLGNMRLNSPTLAWFYSINAYSIPFLIVPSLVHWRKSLSISLVTWGLFFIRLLDRVKFLVFHPTVKILWLLVPQLTTLFSLLTGVRVETPTNVIIATILNFSYSALVGFCLILLISVMIFISQNVVHAEEGFARLVQSSDLDTRMERILVSNQAETARIQSLVRSNIFLMPAVFYCVQFLWFLMNFGQTSPGLADYLVIALVAMTAILLLFLATVCVPSFVAMRRMKKYGLGLVYEERRGISELSSALLSRETLPETNGQKAKLELRRTRADNLARSIDELPGYMGSTLLKILVSINGVIAIVLFILGRSLPIAN